MLQETIAVFTPDGEGRMVINKEDFNPSVHKPYKEPSKDDEVKKEDGKKGKK